ncbi:MAG: hypothetical protein LUI39_11740 [Lachnospiraceae bacterium]|nr:hypothetical protein [Lachnospiraceae bacterium]
MKRIIKNAQKSLFTFIIFVTAACILCPVPHLAASGNTLPDPNDYFNGVCDGWTDNMDELSSIAYLSDTSLEEAVESYEAILISDYNFELTSYNDSGRGTGPVLTYEGNADKGSISCYSFGYMEDADTGMGDGYFVVLFYENVSDFSWEKEDDSEEISDANGATLPDLGIFLNCGRGEDMDYQENGHLLSYSFDLDDGPDAVIEVIELLQESQYELSLVDIVEKNYISSSALLCEYYLFSYTGTDDEVSSLTYDLYDLSFDVLVQTNYYYSQGRTGVTIYYSNGFTVVEPDSRAVNQPVDYSGSGNSAGTDTGGSSGSNIADFARKDCCICDGSGKCPVCKGDGYLWSLVADEENRNCWRCNTKGDCWACGGSGKQ